MTFLLPGRGLVPAAYNTMFLISMVAIAAIVLAVSREVCVFLLDAGVLFERFFERMARLVVPAFAFFTFYSLLVIIFGTIYRILDHYSDAAHFTVGGIARQVPFSESLYFSIVTLSTVGYGDIVSQSELVRVIVAIEILLGVLLLLFGFSEINAYSRERGCSRH